MAAGLGFKDFTTGEVLTAADVDGYLMQGVWVFASATARDAAVTSPQEGNFAYLKDTNVTTYYTGSAWANLDTTGLTNPMTTTGDIIYSSPGSTPVRLGIGTAGQVLKVNSGATAPEWGAASSSSTFVGCQAEKISSAQSLTNNTESAVTFNSEVFDTDGFHDNSTNNSRITIPSGKAGKYLLTAQISFAANATGARVVKFKKNGSDFMLGNVIAAAPATDFTVINNSTLVNASVGDYFEVFALQSSGGSLNLNFSSGNGVGCFFGATFVGA
jgi:hypothetical protein